MVAMPGGRPPKPIEVKRRNGNPGKRALPKRGSSAALEPVGPNLPAVPIALQVHGRGTWTTIWTGGQAWLSPRVDLIRVETVCRLVDDLASYREYVFKLGPLLEEPIVTPTGLEVGTRFVPNPAVKMLRDAEKQLDRELSALGFDPASRSKLGLAEVKKQSILETLGLGPNQSSQGSSQKSTGQGTRQTARKKSTGTEDSKIIDAEVVEIFPDT